jgi:hypothetical protein
MNRREVLGKAVATIVASGLAWKAELQTVEAEPLPLLCVMKLADWHWPTDQEIDRVQAKWAALFNGKPPCPLVVLPPGMTLEAIIDPRKAKASESV